MRGFHGDYLVAKIECLLERYATEPLTDTDIYFEVIPGKGSFNYLYRPIDYESAINLGLLTHDSKLARIMRKYNLNTLILAGCEISGPTYGMLKAVEKICTEKQIMRSIDLFSGTGSLAKVVLENSSSFVDCVDTNTQITPYTLKEYKGRYQIHNIDAFNFLPNVNYDLLILDPFYDHAFDVAEIILPRFRDITMTVVFDIGLEIQRYWTAQIKKSIERTCDCVTYKHIGENLIAIIEFK
jgi:16S rRNA G966 N2-methylase RsmD